MSTHVAAMESFHSFLWLSSIPFCICTTSSLSILCWWTFRWLPVLAVVNSAAMNIRVHVYFQIMVLSVFIPIPKKGNAEECSKWSESHSIMSNSLQPHGLYSPWNSLGQNTGVGSLSLLHGIFPTQESNWGLPQCRQIFTSWATREAMFKHLKECSNYCTTALISQASKVMLKILQARLQ